MSPERLVGCERIPKIFLNIKDIHFQSFYYLSLWYILSSLELSVLLRLTSRTRSLVGNGLTLISWLEAVPHILNFRQGVLLHKKSFWNLRFKQTPSKIASELKRAKFAQSTWIHRVEIPLRYILQDAGFLITLHVLLLMLLLIQLSKRMRLTSRATG